MAQSKQNGKASSELPDAFSLFRPSWQAFKLNIDAFALQLLFPFGLFLLASLLMGMDGASAKIFAVCTILAAFAAGVAIVGSLIVTELASVRGKKIRFEEAVRQGLHYLLRLVGLLLLSGLVIVIGIVLLVVPGLFAIQRLLLAPYFLVDQNIGVIEAMRRSNAAAKKHSSAVWGVAGVLIAINLFSLIPTIGWPVSTALGIVYLCAPTLRYAQIRKIKVKTT